MAQISVWQLAVWRNLHTLQTGAFFGHLSWHLFVFYLRSSRVFTDHPRPWVQKGKTLSDFSCI